MTYLENLLATVFSADVGLSDSGIARALADIRANPDRRELDGLRDELRAMLNSDDTDWVSLLDSEKSEVMIADTQEDGKKFIVDNVWNPLFSEK